ncbi:MAG TPA: DUF4349 domain-containing protein [Mycobacteriales bacterium]|jgi:hypothetical protein|nr:DUF4349 domain-containing protein [Mycobacteriales bacterium]
MRLGQRARVTLIGTCAVLVVLIAIAFAVGGSGSSTTESAGSASSTSGRAGGLSLAPAGVPSAANGPTEDYSYAAGKVATQNAVRGALPTVAAPPGAAASGSGGGATALHSTAGGVAPSAATVSDASSVDATRIVKTGELTVRVQKNKVQTATQSLTTLAASQGGYVSSSSSDLGAGEPSSEVVLRIPVAHFDDAVTKAEALGHVVSITTSADDVTGKYVDLNAKEHALERSRSTYLSILSRASTIGATLSVQQRIDDIQQQIDSLHGQIKLLGNQSSYSTLTVDVVPVGVNVFVTPHHSRHGIGKAWHDSWSRFSRGIDALVGAIGPIVFALLLLALIGAVGLVGYRGVRRVTGPPQAP